MAVGGGGSGTAGIAGSASVNDTEHTTYAWLGIGTEVNVDNAGASATQGIAVDGVRHLDGRPASPARWPSAAPPASASASTSR